MTTTKSAVDRIRSALVDTPFRHAVVHNFFEDDLYWALHSQFPKPETVIGGRPTKPNHLYQMHAAQALRSPVVSGLWKQVLSEFVDPVTNKTMASMCPNAPVGSVGLRYRDHDDYEVDALFGVNTPVQAEGSVKGPHLDNPRELFACLVYFPEIGDEAGGDLGIYRYTKAKPTWFGQRFTKDVELVATVPYSHNTAIFFANGPNALHGVMPRKATGFYRRYLNIETEFCRPLFAMP